ncbi:hypothetical protein BZM27_27560 [Paraburkholderia steynii]|uniref:Uncharacterized protein n=1 Tax=Paraburkholderia steynii TaxID=1245441 RepID=A0A4R0X894_9BURK|nr:hypothetical protein BZM27_27560 [Paraburkholderia steynii]
MLTTKPGKPVDGYRCPTSDWTGPRDVSLRLAVWAIGGFDPDPRHARGDYFLSTPALRCAKSSLSRGIQRLMERGLLTYAAKWTLGLGNDYLLTEDGIESGTAYEDSPLFLKVALQAFGMVLPGPEIVNKCPSKYDTPEGVLGLRSIWMQSAAMEKLYNRRPSPNGFRAVKSVECQPKTVTVDGGADRRRCQPIVETVDEVAPHYFVNQ